MNKTEYVNDLFCKEEPIATVETGDGWKGVDLSQVNISEIIKRVGEKAVKEQKSSYIRNQQNELNTKRNCSQPNR